VKPEKNSPASRPFIVLYDDLEAKEPATFQFMLHALDAFAIDESKSRLSVQQARAGVEVQYLSPSELTFRQWDGFSPPPTKEFPNQWHVEAGTVDKQGALSMLTVLVPHRAGDKVQWTAERIETEATIGVRLVCGNEPTTVTIGKTDVSNTVRVERK
jgi:hypothetical protein